MNAEPHDGPSKDAVSVTRVRPEALERKRAAAGPPPAAMPSEESISGIFCKKLTVIDIIMSGHGGVAIDVDGRSSAAQGRRSGIKQEQAKWTRYAVC
jgi:hypothetical protein